MPKRIAIVTGGGNGIGQAVSLGLAKGGAKVSLTDAEGGGTGGEGWAGRQSAVAFRAVDDVGTDADGGKLRMQPILLSDQFHRLLKRTVKTRRPILQSLCCGCHRVRFGAKDRQ